MACTDGITEARDRGAGRALLGTRGLAEIMRALIRADGLPTCDELMERVADRIGGNFHDDATTVFAVPFVEELLPLRCSGADGGHEHHRTAIRALS